MLPESLHNFYVRTIGRVVSELVFLRGLKNEAASCQESQLLEDCCRPGSLSRPTVEQMWTELQEMFGLGKDFEVLSES